MNESVHAGADDYLAPRKIRDYETREQGWLIRDFLVVTGYFVTASALMLVTGTLADIVGRLRLFGIDRAHNGSGKIT